MIGLRKKHKQETKMENSTNVGVTTGETLAWTK